MSSLKERKVTDRFDSFTTKKSYKISHTFDCIDKCLICLVSCRTWGKQYKGKTTDCLGIDYKMEARKPESSDRENVKQ